MHSMSVMQVMANPFLVAGVETAEEMDPAMNPDVVVAHKVVHRHTTVDGGYNPPSMLHTVTTISPFSILN